MKVAPSVFFLFLLAFTVIVFVAYNPQILQKISSSSSKPFAFPNSKCHAIHLDPNDDQAFNSDPTCTPGSINPLVTQENINTTICVKGFTKIIRPPASYTNALKKKQIGEYGYLDTNMKQYEEDHLISLELGGSAKDPQNLWPEPHASVNEKDQVENYLHDQVCKGKMSLHEAQVIISTRWYEVYKQQFDSWW